LVDIVTLATLASRAPVLAPSPAVTDWSAMITPRMSAPAPTVADEPTLHQTFTQSLAELTMTTLACVTIINVEVVWKIHAAFGSFWASSVRVPSRPRPPSLWYTPAVRVRLPSCSSNTWSGTRLEASKIAAAKSDCA
jgi:hypothetical protein